MKPLAISLVVLSFATLFLILGKQTEAQFSARRSMDTRIMEVYRDADASAECVAADGAMICWALVVTGGRPIPVVGRCEQGRCKIIGVDDE